MSKHAENISIMINKYIVPGTDDEFRMRQAAIHLRAAEAHIKKLEAFKSAVVGWREHDHPEWFCRRTAEEVVNYGRSAEDQQ